MAVVHVDKEECKGCSICIATCPREVLMLTKDELNQKGYNYIVVNESKCFGCALCATMCPESALTVK